MILNLGIQAALAVNGYENVIFRQQDEVTVTMSSWLVTFHINVEPLEELLEMFSDQLERARGESERTLSAMGDNTPVSGPAASKIRDDFEGLLADKVRVVQRYGGLRLMGDSGRKKRSLLPFVGDALGYLFGVTSSSDLNLVRKAINSLQGAQKDVVHIVEDNISIINITRREVDKNRHTINGLIGSMKSVVSSIDKRMSPIQRRLSGLESLLHGYWHYRLVVDKLRKFLADIEGALDRLEFQLNMLSVGQLAPSVVTPRRLRIVLEDVARSLPSNLKLTKNPRTDLWYYYKTIGCSTILDHSTVVIIIRIPVLDTEHVYRVYRILNFPIPLPTHTQPEGAPRWAASFRLESQALAVNKDRTKYILLSDVEALHCSANSNEICRIHSPIYITNGRGSCEMALFRRRRTEVERYCKVTVGSNSRFPMAVSVGKGVWVIATHESIDFSVSCMGGDRDTVDTVTARAPLSTVRIGDGCTAYGDSIILSQQLRGSSAYDGLDVIKIPPINVTDSAVWSPITQKFPNFSASSIPAALRDIEEIPVSKMMEKLEILSRNRPLLDGQTSSPHILWIVSALAIGVAFAALVGVGCWCKRRLAKQPARGEFLKVPIQYGVTGGSKEAQTTNIQGMRFLGDVAKEPAQARGEDDYIVGRPLRLFSENEN